MHYNMSQRSTFCSNTTSLLAVTDVSRFLPACEHVLHKIIELRFRQESSRILDITRCFSNASVTIERQAHITSEQHATHKLPLRQSSTSKLSR